eukprot:INCI5619.1.p1 GENE.INCI5619.1~~INCI5619.1.p1  ORF type:complete len:376 (+),score=54.29 INCI5619.1:89-1129(+)
MRIAARVRGIVPTAVRTFSSSNGRSMRGVFPIMATPFHRDESVDVEGFRRSIRFMADAGANGVTIVGVLGESNRLVDSERCLLIEAAVEEARLVKNGRDSDRSFDICVGTSHTGTEGTAALSALAQGLGADAVMVTPSKEPVNTDDDLLALYARVADRCPGLPIVLQDHPASTQVHMSPELIARIVQEVPTISCIKLESVPTPARIARLRSLWALDAPPQGNVSILTGLGALYAGFDMEQGTDGFMTGFAFPEILLALNDAAQHRDMDLVHKIYQKYLPLIVFEQQPGVAVRKELYRLRGLIECAHVRHPGKSITDVMASGLRQQVERSLPNVDITKPIPTAALHC